MKDVIWMNINYHKQLLKMLHKVITNYELMLLGDIFDIQYFKLIKHIIKISSIKSYNPFMIQFLPYFGI